MKAKKALSKRTGRKNALRQAVLDPESAPKRDSMSAPKRSWGTGVPLDNHVDRSIEDDES